MNKAFSHIDEHGNVRMVDVGGKRSTRRSARARCKVRMKQSTLRAIVDERIKKGNVLVAAKLAGIQAAKRVDELIPLCHSLHADHIDIVFTPEHGSRVLCIDAEVSVVGKTGAEMEALQAAAQAALTVYDMCKGVDRGMVISDLCLIEKRGGRSGLWKRR